MRATLSFTRPFTSALILSLAIAASAGGQSAPDTVQQADHPRFASFGVSGGVMHFGDGGYERAVSAAIAASLSHGFSLSVNPTFAWAQAAPTADAITGRMVTPPLVHGLADLPVNVGFYHALPGAWSPSFSVSLGATLPIGDTTKVGSGEVGLGANIGVGVAPVEGWSFGAGAGHTLSNEYASGLGSIAPTTVSLDVSHSVGHAELNLGYSTEMGVMPVGTTHSQNFAGGASFPLGGAAALTVSGSTGTADGVRSWAMAVGIGTTFADVARVSPFGAVSQLANALGKGRSLSKSRSTAAKTAAAERKLTHKKLA
ncbi:MAG TPA: hypothetical protein VGJ96_03275 [Gemmatimonadaceae bacterium]|jgi:hypothetical protein